MISRAGRVVAASALLGMAGAGVASVPAAASSGPVVVGTCGAHVHAKKGQRLELSLSHALGVDGLPSIPLGTAQTGTHHYNPKGDIKHTLASTGLLGGTLGGITGTVGHVLDAGCPVVVTVKHVVNHAATPVGHVTQKATKPVHTVTGGLLGSHPSARHTGKSQHHTSGSAHDRARHSHEPAPHPAEHSSTHHRRATVSPALAQKLVLPTSAFSVPTGAYGGGISPAAFDAALPSEYPGLFSPPHFPDLDGGVPGLAPAFTLPGKIGAPAARKARAEAMHTAGNAQALGARTHRHTNTVSLPPLVAALALAGAVAALVRTWVLRRPTT
jgi:hypothetical protein